MPRLSITFYNDIFNQLQGEAVQNHISIAHYVRDLVTIGLRVEEAAAKEEMNSSPIIDELANLNQLWESNLSWLLESLHLIRYLIRTSTHDGNLSAVENKGLSDGIITKAKEKAKFYVNDLLCEKR
jgi:hypothetical protein